MLMNWFSVISSASAMISSRPTLRSSCATVRPCFSCIVIVLSSPSSTARSMRRASRRTSRSPSQASAQMTDQCQQAAQDHLRIHLEEARRSG